MLVLSRRESQSIMIGQDIVITVISIRGDQVRIGIEAPRAVTVHRQEVAAAIEAANRAALATGDFDPTALPAPRPRSAERQATGPSSVPPPPSRPGSEG
jgi:carbon storage regulator